MKNSACRRAGQPLAVSLSPQSRRRPFPSASAISLGIGHFPRHRRSSEPQSLDWSHKAGLIDRRKWRTGAGNPQSGGEITNENKAAKRVYFAHRSKLNHSYDTAQYTHTHSENAVVSENDGVWCRIIVHPSQVIWCTLSRSYSFCHEAFTTNWC